MKIIDSHCDVLYKMQMHKRMNGVALDFRTAPELAANLRRLQLGGVYVQFFAIFVSPEVPDNEKWVYACEQVELFHKEVIGNNPEMKHIRKWSDIAGLKTGEIGAVLSLEGVEPIGKDLEKLAHLFERGVLSLGLTWNKANLAADGALDSNYGGLTDFGREIVALNNECGVMTDLSHLAEASFWEVLELADYPFASHSNVRTICDHPRNLSDIQLSALFAKGATVHVTFYPPFIGEHYKVVPIIIDDIIRHIDYMCSLGGAQHIGFGSDFDGIDLSVNHLENASTYPDLLEKLLIYYSVEEVEGFTSGNFLRYVSRLNGDGP